MKSNHTECQASLLRDKEAQRITEQCNTSSSKHCNATKETQDEIRDVQEKKGISREGMKQGTSSRFKKGFKIIVKVCLVDQVDTFQNFNPNMSVFG